VARMAMPGRGVPVRITQGVMAQHSRGGFMRAMAQFGEVVYCRKPPFSGIEGEDYVNIGFATQTAADKAYAELKAGNVMVDGVLVGVGPSKFGGPRAVDESASRAPTARRDSRSPDRRGQRRPPREQPIRGTFKQRHDERSPSPRTMMREAMMTRQTRHRSPNRPRDRSRSRRRRRKRSSSGSRSRS